ncbi:hypothetical protein D4R42_01365, partial [bacterium]
GITDLNWSSGTPFVKMTAPGTFALSSTSYQPLDADLTAIAALGFTATSFLKKTAANTWALDTNTYLGIITGGSEGDILKLTADGQLISAGFSYSEVSLDGHEHSAADITSGTLSNSRLDADLASIAGLGFTALAFLKKTATNTWALDTTAYQEYDIILDGITDLNWSSGTPFVKMTAPGTFALSSTSYQPLDADLTAIAALGYTATSFLKKTAANTWALDTNTYAPTATGGSTGDMLKQTAGGGFISAGFSYSEVSLDGHEHSAAEITSGTLSNSRLDADLASIAGLGFTNLAFLKKTAANTWALDTTAYQEYDVNLDGISALAWSSGAPIVTMTAPGTFALSSTSYQPLDADLTAIAALGFTATSFLKKTAANTWALDTNTYAPTATGGSTGDMLKQTAGGGFISAGFSYSEVSLDGHEHTSLHYSGSAKVTAINTGITVNGVINVGDHISTLSYVEIGTTLYLRGSTYLLNKAISGWLPFATRDTSGSDAVFNLQNIGYVSASDHISTLSYVEIGTTLYLKGSTYLLNKAKSGWLNFATRDTSGSDAVFNLQNIGYVSASGQILGGSYATTNWTIAESGNALQFKRGASLYLELNSSGATSKVLQGDGSWISKGDVFTAFQTLTYAASKTWDIDNGYNAKITLTGDCSLTITNADNGTSGCLIVIQDASGGHTLSFASPTYNKVIDGGLLTLDESANVINILTFVSDGTNLYWSYGNNYLSPS